MYRVRVRVRVCTGYIVCLLYLLYVYCIYCVVYIVLHCIHCIALYVDCALCEMLPKSAGTLC